LKRIIHWFRRDLRVRDNTALAEADRRAEQVIPIFILEEAFRTGPDVGAGRLAFLLQTLRELEQALKTLGYPLIVRSGRSEQLLPALCQELGAEAVFCNRRYEPYAQARDERVFHALNGAGYGFEIFKDAVIWEGEEILSKAGEPYTVFTPYSKAWKAKPIPGPRPDLRPARGTFPQWPSERLPASTAELGHSLTQGIPPGGEAAALNRWEQFRARQMAQYATGRDFPALEGTSQLSPHLRCGSIGIRTIVRDWKHTRAALGPEGQASCDRFLGELIWREFYLQILTNFPQVARGPFRPQYSSISWSDNREHFERWCAGMTGYPIVDAAMRCLKATGFMHNRLRMIVAMFLTKDLLLNWQWGERYFMHQLVDGDMASNNGGWQWCAGTGTDAAPYFRIFNPVSQSTKFDPDGLFIKRWVPELESAGAKLIHEPWNGPLLLRQSGYPARIVLHEEQRGKFLTMFKKSASEGG
jgi:deoxyribodipyrimidine photo-lyase